MAANRRLALMIDGDNAEAALLPQVLAEVSRYGIMTIRRVYGDWTTTQLKGWKEILHTYALKPEQQFSYTTGKNSTDSALIIDAMDIIYTAGVDGICIVSSDSDYTRLATRIREKNLFVMGIGRKLTPRSFVNACDIFVYTENLPPVTEDDELTPSVPKSKTKKSSNKQQSLKQMFLTAFDSVVQEDGWASLSALGNSLRQLDPGFDPRTYGHKLLSQLVDATPYFETQKRNNAIYIRLKQNGKS